MIDERFVFLAVILTLWGDLSYIIDTIKGKVKPNKVTWLLWALAPLLAFSAQFKQGVGLSSLMTFAVGFIPLFIFLASFLNRKSEWKITTFDLVCGALSLAGLLLWAVTRVENLAILLGIIADGLAAAPTIVKSYQAPETENYQAYLFNGMGAVITLLTITSWDFAHLAFPVYLFSVCLILFLLIRFKIGKKILLFLS